LIWGKLLLVKNWDSVKWLYAVREVLAVQAGFRRARLIALGCAR
jgi:hypothetical protein